MKKQDPPYDPLRKLGPFDLVQLCTLERMCRVEGKMTDAEAREYVQRLVVSKIKITKYTGLLSDAPLYQKIDK